MQDNEAVPMYVGGRPMRGGGSIRVRENPARVSETVGSVSCATAEETHAAIEAAHAASAAWAALPVEERVQRLREAWRFGEAERDDLARTLTRELGKAIADTRGELDYGIAFAEYCAEHSPEVFGDRVVRDELGILAIKQVPFGVVAAIIPWNAPLNISSTVVAPALFAGNTVVVKPSPLAPIAVTRYLSAIASRLPAGVLNVVNGDAPVGEALTTSPLVGKIAFTGSTEVGRHILRGAAGNVTPSLLELGGNDGALILEDADLGDEALARLVFASFLTGGQICMAAKRLYVPERMLDEFVERYTAIADRVLVMGDPFDPSVTLGPLVSARQRDGVRKIVEDAVAEGATAIELGSVQPGYDLDGGYYLTPTLVVGAAQDSYIVREEQFGPTVPMVPYSSLEEGIALVNDSPYGLCASVWSADRERAIFEIGPRLQVGTVFINTHNRSGMSLRAPFGGRKLSGFGREYGIAGLQEFSQTQSISLLASTEAGGGLAAGRRYQAVVA